MRYFSLILVALLASVVLLAMQHRSAQAAFHCTRIHAVMAGFQGNDSIQYVELRMSAGSQTLVGGHQVKFYDASGTLKATFTFPNGVGSGSVGSSILIGTQEFNDNTIGGDADFTFSGSNTVGVNGGDPLHPIEAPDGKVTEYSLETVSSSTFAVAQGSLPSDLSTPRNNGRTVLQLALLTPTPTPPPVGGLAELPGVAAPPLSSAGSSSGNPVALAMAGAGGTVAVVTFLAGAAWYIRKRGQA